MRSERFVRSYNRAGDPPRVPGYFTPGELADAARVTRKTVYNWLRSGRLKGIKMGPREWRITKEQFETFQRLHDPQRPNPAEAKAAPAAAAAPRKRGRRA